MSSKTLIRPPSHSRPPTKSQPSELLGCQVPQIKHLPVGVTSLDAAEECIELAEAYGPPRDEAQKTALRAFMGTQADGRWAAALAALAESRQNGKGDVVEDRELYGLVVLGEPIIHTSHELPTSKNAHLRLVARLEGSRDLRTKVQRIRYGNGDLGIEMKSGGVIIYRARTGGGARGLDDVALVVYDEAQHLQAEHMAASSPTMAVNPNPQTIMTGSAGLAISVKWGEIRRNALAKVGGRFAYLEHTAETVSLDDDGDLVSLRPDPHDVAMWAWANPAYGARISQDFLASQLTLLGPVLFAREHLGVWDTLPTVTKKAKVIVPERWTAAGDANSRAVGPVALAVEVAPDSESAAVVFAGGRADGAAHVEVLEVAAGVGWLIDRLRRALTGGEIGALAIEEHGSVASIAPELRALAAEFGVEFVVLGGGEFAGGCEAFVAGVSAESPTVRHINQVALSTSVDGVQKRKYGERWVWHRDAAAAPVVAATVALRAWQLMPKKPAFEPFFVMT